MSDQPPQPAPTPRPWLAPAIALALAVAFLLILLIPGVLRYRAGGLDDADMQALRDSNATLESEIARLAQADEAGVCMYEGALFPRSVEEADGPPEPGQRLDLLPPQPARMTPTPDALPDEVAFAAERSAAAGVEDRQWGALLEAIQQQPAEVPLADRLFGADGQPVLIQWGCRGDATVATGTLLRERLAAPPPPRMAGAPAGGVVGAVPAGPVAVATAAGPGRGWLPLLLWLLFAATMALIFWWLLAACALNLPPSFPLFGQCSAAGTDHSEKQR